MSSTSLIGLDFDNTLINYDRLFFTCALESDLIPESLSADKATIRNYLRRTGREDEWTRLQGQVYGYRIMEAPAQTGMLDALLKLQQEGLKMCLVSHKTKVPYLGGSHDLRLAARSWLEAKGFFDDQGLGWSSDQVHFESTKAEKVERIVSLGCSHFVDDLREILEMLPGSISIVLFAPEDQQCVPNGWVVLDEWAELPDLLR